MNETKRARYTLEFKMEAVRLVRGGQVAAVTAKVPGIPKQTLENWVRLDGKGKLKGAGDSQFGSDEFNRWCQDNRLSPSMSRSGNCWDNAVAESFFGNLKSEKIKRQIYSTRDQAKSEVFDYIEGFYNRVRRHKHLDQISPHEFERQSQTAL